MSNRKFWLIYTILVLCQIVICNYLNFSPLVSVSLLPAMVMCIPVSIKTPWAMVIAFFTGLVVDFTADAVPGLNALALVPVALIRSGVLRLVIGSDIDERADALSFKAKGFTKIAGICLIAVAVFHAVYIAADGAGTRTFLFCAAQFAISVTVSFLLSLLVVRTFSQTDRQ